MTSMLYGFEIYNELDFSAWAYVIPVLMDLAIINKIMNSIGED